MDVQRFWLQIELATTSHQVFSALLDNAANVNVLVPSGDTGAVTALCSMLERFSEDVYTCDAALRFIRYGVRSWTCSLSVVSKNAVSLVVRAMETHASNTNTQRLCIQLLASFPDQLLEMSAIGVIAAAMLENQDVGIQHAGYLALCDIAMRGRKFRNAICTSGGARALLSPPIADCAERYDAISCLADGAVSQTQLGGAIPAIVNLLLDTNYCTTTCLNWHAALKAVRNLIIFHADNTALFLSLGGVQAIVCNATLPSPDISIVVCEIVACIGYRHTDNLALSFLLAGNLAHHPISATACLADMLIHPHDYKSHNLDISYGRLVGQCNLTPVMRSMLGRVVPWNYDKHYHFPPEIRRQIATVFVLARSDNARTRLTFPKLTTVVLNRLLDTLAWTAYGC